MSTPMDQSLDSTRMSTAQESAVSPRSKWPKQIPAHTEEQRKIYDDFLKGWLDLLQRKYSVLETFNHGYVVKHTGKDFKSTLEIGIGTGGHLAFEQLTPEQEKNYYGVDIRESLLQKTQERYPRINTSIADCQKTLPFSDGFFDRILAIHVLEHLPNLPATIREMYRLCNKERGKLSLVIPAEGGLAYCFARKISTKPMFEKKYKQNYDEYMKREHINLPHEVFEELHPYFEITNRSFFPLVVPVTALNLVIGATLKPRPKPLTTA